MSDQRALIVSTALSWVGTPYHHRAKVKGAGADCATLLVAVFEEAGLVSPITLPAYSPQWHLNRDYQLYLSVILEHCTEVSRSPLPGDLVLWKFGRVLSHGAIVIEWPRIVHAVIGTGVILDDADKNARLTTMGIGEASPGLARETHHYSFWGD